MLFRSRTPYAPNSLQVQMVSRMSFELKSRGCSWVVPCDDDEFYIGDIRAGVLKAERNGYNVLYQDGFCYYTTEMDSKDINPVRRLTWRDPDTFDYAYRKAIHSTKNFISVTPGNHWINFSVPSRSFKDSSLRINHYNHREKKSFNNICAMDTFTPLTIDQIHAKKLV